MGGDHDFPPFLLKKKNHVVNVSNSIKNFLQSLWGAFVHLLASLVLLIGLLVLFFWSVSPRVPQVGEKTVLQVSLSGQVVEKPMATPWEGWVKQEEGINLIAFKQVMKAAQEDRRIRGVYLEMGGISAGWTSLEEMRKVLEQFKASGKFIVAYGEFCTQRDYFLASLADHITLNPGGRFLLQGASYVTYFYKNLLDRLHVTPQVFRAGRYKSFVEPFIRQGMSAESKHQFQVFLQGIYNRFVTCVADARSLQPSSIRAMADSLSVLLPHRALDAKLVDEVAYASDAEAWVLSRLGLKDKKEVTYVPWSKYPVPNVTQHDHKIAVLVASGEIVDGKGGPEKIASKHFVQHIRKVREDDNIKALVVRINSVGGSAMASEVLWKELTLTRKIKPVVASLVDVAASGGYYMAAACDHIVAGNNTSVGSIGVFLLSFDVHSALQRIGVTTDVVKTNSSADWGINWGRSLTSHEKASIQEGVDQSYRSFLSRVAEGRKKSVKAIESVASGRVWLGSTAKEKGLVDQIGGLEDAVQEAAKRAKLDEGSYTTVYAPTTGFFHALYSFSHSMQVSWMSHVLPVDRKYLETLEMLQNIQGVVQARWPYEVTSTK